MKAKSMSLEAIIEVEVHAPEKGAKNGTFGEVECRLSDFAKMCCGEGHKRYVVATIDETVEALLELKAEITKGDCNEQIQR